MFKHDEWVVVSVQGGLGGLYEALLRIVAEHPEDDYWFDVAVWRRRKTA